jgi:hypothetical protein
MKELWLKIRYKIQNKQSFFDISNVPLNFKRNDLLAPFYMKASSLFILKLHLALS